MVGDDDGLIIVGLGSLDDVAHAVVHSVYGLGDGIVDAGMAYHVTIGKVHDDEVILLGVDGTNELVLHLVGRHLGLQVVGGHLG